jgi:hypothetical protein
MMNKKQQAIKTRHITDSDAMNAYTIAVAKQDETSKRIQAARLVLHNYLNPNEIERLNKSLAGQLPGMQALIVDRWFDWAVARESVIKADCRVRSNHGQMIDWALWDRTKAVENARQMGLIIVTRKISGDVVSVELPC